MTRDEYDDWREHHRTLFQMKSADDIPMFDLWMPSLLEFSFGEMCDASLAIATDVAIAGKFRTEHLGLLKQKVTAKRFERTKAEFAELDRQRDAQSCGVCGGCGNVSVPHPNFVREGVWVHPFYLLAVGCDCNRGSLWFNAISTACRERNEKPGARKIDVMDLRTYEAIQPHWKAMVESRNRQRDAERKSEWYASKADKSDAIIASSVAEQLRRLKAIGVNYEQSNKQMP